MRARRLALLLVALCLSATAQDRRNAFDDPFLQVTSALPGCPVPRPPGYTEAQVREEAHVRAQHGTSCYLSGRCRLANSYSYDKEIVPRVQKAIRYDSRFADSTVWVKGERRIVTLYGCVQTKEQGAEIERVVGLIDDVMGVVNKMMVGTKGKPAYELAP